MEPINTTHEKDILDTISKHPIFSFKDIFVFYKGCSRATAYNHALDRLDSIKEAIYSNKRRGVTTLLSKWLSSENATLQLAAMRLVADDDERKKLSMNHTDVTTNGRDIKSFNLPEYMRKDLEDGESEL
jgi:hypothetical protein